MSAREIHCAEALAWLRERGVVEGACAVTSLPDVSEVRLGLEDWKVWFSEAVRAVVAAVPPEGAALFFQSDIKRDGLWIDKGQLVGAAAEAAGARLLFHKIVARCPAGKLTYGRPGYTHLHAFSVAAKCPDVTPIPDIIADPGRQPWVRAMGVRAAAHAVRFARDALKARIILDPFCGVGTVPAVANALGLDAIGVELNRKRAEQARQLVLAPDEL